MDTALSSLSSVIGDIHHWIGALLLITLQIGFITHVTATARGKHRIHVLRNQLMVIPVLSLSCYLVGWWIYHAFPMGSGIAASLSGAGEHLPWSQLMAGFLYAGDLNVPKEPHVSWVSFMLMSSLVGAVIAGATIERIRAFALLLLVFICGSIFWAIGAAWGFSADGWMVQVMGFHDAFGGGTLHGVAGGFCLAVLLRLGPRIGKFDASGSAHSMFPHNPTGAATGRLLIIIGLLGMTFVATTPMIDVQSGEGVFFSLVTIYNTPTTLSGVSLNFFLAMSAGLLVGLVLANGHLTWTLSGGLAGIVGTASGADLYHPLQAFIVAGFIVWLIHRMHRWLENKFYIDDAIAAVAVHGFAGWLGVVIAGFLLWGYPASPGEAYVIINPLGQFIGAMILFWVVGYIPGYIAAGALEYFDLLRVPEAVEIAGIDLAAEVEMRQDADAVIKSEKQAVQELIDSRG